MKNRIIVSLLAIFFCSIIFSTSHSLDTEITRKTMKGLQGVNVAVEEFQSNIQKYAKKNGLTREQIQKDVETKLKSAGIKIITFNEWLITPGRPLLYINVNTHEYEKYWYAYDIKIDVQQIVYLDANPSIKTMAGTWSLNMTGIANIGTLNSIRNNVGKMTDKFIEAYRSVN